MAKQGSPVKLSKIIAIVAIVVITAASLVFLYTKQKEGIVLDVVNLSKADLKTRLLVISLQGIVNRDSPRLYVTWWNPRLKFNPSIEWLKYYKQKEWIKGWRIISIEEAINKYKKFVKGIVVYDPEMLDTVDLAVTLSGLYDLVIAHPDYVPLLKEKGLSVKYDLRGKFRSRLKLHQWQLKNLFLYCNKSIIFLYPTDTQIYALARSCLIDLAVRYRACAVNLRVDVPSEAALFAEYLKQMKPMGILIGYPHLGSLETPTVKFISTYGIRGILATHDAPNFSIHSQIGKKKSRYLQGFREIRKVEDKIYVALFACDLALNSMQNFYYGLWKSENRGKIPITWWFDPIVADFCPGIVLYYYETRTEQDYFFAANTYGRITPSDFKYLDELLKMCDEQLRKFDLRVLGFSDSCFNKTVLRKYAQKLTYVYGFGYGYIPSNITPNYWLEEGKPYVGLYSKAMVAGTRLALYRLLKYFADTHKERPAFLLVYLFIGDYITVDDILWVKNRLDQEYPGVFKWVRGDEFMSAVKAYLEKSSG